MGGCVAKSSFTVNKQSDIKFSSIQPYLFGMEDAEHVLVDAEPGDYLLYRDHKTERLILSVRRASYIRHYKITELNNLYYLDGQPYAYLDSIILYHRKHKLHGERLNKQAHLSARIVRTFAHKVARSNGNLHLYTNKNSLLTPHAAEDNTSSLLNYRHSRNSSNVSLLTSSSESAGRRQMRL